MSYFQSSFLSVYSYVPTVPIIYEWEIPDLHRNILIIKTKSLFVDFSDKLTSNNFSGVKKDFRFCEKSEKLSLMRLWVAVKVGPDPRFLLLLKKVLDAVENNHSRSMRFLCLSVRVSRCNVERSFDVSLLNDESSNAFHHKKLKYCSLRIIQKEWNFYKGIS